MKGVMRGFYLLSTLSLLSLIILLLGNQGWGQTATSSSLLRIAIAPEIDRQLLDQIKTEIVDKLFRDLVFTVEVIAPLNSDPSTNNYAFPFVRDAILDSCTDKVKGPIDIVIGSHKEMMESLNEDKLFAFSSESPRKTRLGFAAVTFCSRNPELSKAIVFKLIPSPSKLRLFIMGTNDQQKTRLTEDLDTLESLIQVEITEEFQELAEANNAAAEVLADRFQQLLFRTIESGNPYDLLIGGALELHETLASNEFGLIQVGPVNVRIGIQEPFVSIASITTWSQDLESAKKLLGRIQVDPGLTVFTTPTIENKPRFKKALEAAREEFKEGGKRDITVISNPILEGSSVSSILNYIGFRSIPIDIILGGNAVVHETLQTNGELAKDPVDIPGIGSASILKESLSRSLAERFLEILENTP